jgi:hypothetical protein
VFSQRVFAPMRGGANGLGSCCRGLPGRRAARDRRQTDDARGFLTMVLVSTTAAAALAIAIVVVAGLQTT